MTRRSRWRPCGTCWAWPTSRPCARSWTRWFAPMRSPASGCSTSWRPRAATSSGSPTRWWSPCGNSSWSAWPAVRPTTRRFRGVAPAHVAEIARRLAALDANRIGAGGYRFQLELILLEQVPAGDALPVPVLAPAVTAKPAVAAPRGRPKPIRRRRPRSRPPRPPPRRRRLPRPRRKRPPPCTPPAADSRLRLRASEALERLRQGWPEFVERVSANPMLKPVVAACRPVEVRDGVVVLGFPEETPFYREKAEQRRAALEAGVEAVLGRPVWRALRDDQPGGAAAPAREGGGSRPRGPLPGDLRRRPGRRGRDQLMPSGRGAAAARPRP